MKPSVLIICLVLAFSGCQPSTEKYTGPLLDLDKPEDNFTAFLKVRASLNEGEEVVYYWKGSIYSFVAGQRSQHLFDMEAYNIGRIKYTPEGAQLLTREVALYKDKDTGAILEDWFNPFTNDSAAVVHVWNDPVNQVFVKEGWGIDWMSLGNNRASMNADIFLLYPSPLKKEDYPLHVRSDMYQAAELFQFFFNPEEVSDPSVKSANAEVAWTRFSEWLPWMDMGEYQGYMVYQCRGYKLDGGYKALPEHVRKYVEGNFPEFATAPTEYTKPNETSWTYFKKILDGIK